MDGTDAWDFSFRSMCDFNDIPEQCDAIVYTCSMVESLVNTIIVVFLVLIVIVIIVLSF